jgi:hypothetical protein
MSLLSILKTVGKDLSHVGSWVDDALKVVGPIITIVDPELGVIITDIEDILNLIPDTSKLDANTLQSIVTSSAIVTMIHSHGSVTLPVGGQ